MTHNPTSSIPGLLNNLTLELHHTTEQSLFLFSSHRIAPWASSGGPSSSSSSSSRGVALSNPTANRLTPSPTKRAKSATPSPSKPNQSRQQVRLVDWTLSLCQRVQQPSQHRLGIKEEEEEKVLAAGRNDNEEATESETEDEAEDGTPSPIKASKPKQKPEVKVGSGSPPSSSSVRQSESALSLWYCVRVGAQQAEELRKQCGAESWQSLEALLRSAWDKGAVDVLARGEDQRQQQQESDGGGYEHLKLRFTFDQKDLATNGSTALSRRSPSKTMSDGLVIRLERLEEARALQTASDVTIELTKALGTLRSKAQLLIEERDSSRKLLGVNRRHERFNERSGSLINPGRIKRKLQDDEGFEGEEEEEHEPLQQENEGVD